jgi:nucleotide-binding universal stress UspA family protein
VERNGSHARVIAQLATQSDAELIVLGAQSTRPFVAFVETTAERVAARTDLPVLVVNSSCGLHYSNVILTAGSPQFVVNLIGMADRWGLLDAPCLSIVHGLTYRGPMLDGRADAFAASHYFDGAEEAVRALLMNEFSDAGIDPSRFNVTIADEYPLDVVRRALPSSGSSLLVLGTSSHEAFRRVFNGSLANDVLLSLDCDVVLVRPPSRAHSSRPHSRTADHFARRAS